ncbi:MAG: hypothetical protein GYA57_07820 [Myxococcales bacterium]|nr:hypothetical protein [Myxococcales bacterium]
MRRRVGRTAATAGAMWLALSWSAPVAAQETGDPEAAAADDGDVVPDEDGPGWFVGGEIELPSRYVWRGLAWSDGPALQPALWAGAFGLIAWTWANLHLGETTAADPTWEIDAGLDYAHEWNGLGIEAGFDFYAYPGVEDAPPTGELHVKLTVPRGPVTLSTEHAVDVIEYPGAYFGEIAVALAHEPADGLSLEWSFALGWGSKTFNEAYIGPATDAINVARGGVVVQWEPLDLLYLRVRLETSALLEEILREAVGEPVLFVAALAVGSEWAP